MMKLMKLMEVMESSRESEPLSWLGEPLTSQRCAGAAPGAARLRSVRPSVRLRLKWLRRRGQLIDRWIADPNIDCGAAGDT